MKAASQIDRLAEIFGREDVTALLEWLHSLQGLAENAHPAGWDHSVEHSRLRDRGVNDELLRALLEAGLIEHRIEITAARGEQRRFRKARGEPWGEASRFKLTKAGVAAALEALRWMVEEKREAGRKRRRAQPVPRFDAESGELWFGKTLLKRFPVQGAHTVQLLQAFEEAGWTEEDIDNPLPGYDEAVQAKRLREAIRNLNYDLQQIRLEVARGSRQLRWKRIKGS